MPKSTTADCSIEAIRSRIARRCLDGECVMLDAREVFRLFPPIWKDTDAMMALDVALRLHGHLGTICIQQISSVTHLDYWCLIHGLQRMRVTSGNLGVPQYEIKKIAATWSMTYQFQVS